MAIDSGFNTITNGEGICLLAASQAYEEASASLEKNHSVFTYYLLQGLLGKDQEVFDRHGNISADTLNDYIYNKSYVELPDDKKPKQKPVRKIISSGDMIIIDKAYFSKNRPRIFIS